MKRGKYVVLTFSAQGLGSLINTLILLGLIVVLGQVDTTYDPYLLDIVWRSSYGIGTLLLLMLLIWRVLFLEESEVWGRNHSQPANAGEKEQCGKPGPCGRKEVRSRRDASTFHTRSRLLCKYYWHR